MTEKSCATCRFASEERPQPGMIEPVLMCRHGPLMPVLVPVFAPRGGHNVQVSSQVRAMCPAVSAADWCHRHEPLPCATN